MPVRGSTFIFTAGFSDVDGNPVNPISATLYVYYRRNAQKVIDTIPMVVTDFTWTANWDSEVSDGGRTDWHIRTAGSNKAALEGTFTLETNPANPSPS